MTNLRASEGCSQYPAGPFSACQSGAGLGSALSVVRVAGAWHWAGITSRYHSSTSGTLLTGGGTIWNWCFGGLQLSLITNLFVTRIVSISTYQLLIQHQYQWDFTILDSKQNILVNTLLCKKKTTKHYIHYHSMFGVGKIYLEKKYLMLTKAAFTWLT